MKRCYLHLIIPAAALLAAGCSDPATPEAEDELGPRTGMPDGTAETETPGDTPSGEPDRNQTWEITVREFGPFDPSTPYSQEAIAERLPDYQLVESELSTEGIPYPVTMAIPEGTDSPVIVVAGIPGEEATVKTYEPMGDKIALIPRNERLAPMVFDPSEVQIFGRVVTVMRRL